MLFLIFSIVFVGIFAGANFYIYKRLFMQIDFFRQKKRFVALFIVLLFVLQASFLLFRADERFSSPLYQALARTFAPTYFFFFVTLIADILRFVSFLISKSIKKSRFDESRRTAIKVIFNISLLIFAISSVFKGISDAVSVPKVRKFTLGIKNLRSKLRLVMVSDIHLGKNLHEKFLKGLVEKINTLNADIVVIVGDLIDAKPAEIAPYIHHLDAIQSTYGTFYALGNHEYYRGLDGVLGLLKGTKLKILINKNEILRDANDEKLLNIAGLADLAGLREFNGKKIGVEPDLTPILNSQEPNLPSILLAHQPKTAKLYYLSDFDLVLSGHTHGGQVFPFGFIVLLQQGFLHGFYELSSRSKLYVSSGAGFWGPAIRFLAPSEIVCFDLEKDEKA